MTVDTLSLAKDLRAADLSATQAEAIAAAISKALSESAVSRSDFDLTTLGQKAEVESLALKLDGLEKRLVARIDASDDRMIAKIETARASLLIWLIGVIIAGGGLLLTLNRLI